MHLKKLVLLRLLNIKGTFIIMAHPPFFLHDVLKNRKIKDYYFFFPGPIEKGEP